MVISFVPLEENSDGAHDFSAFACLLLIRRRSRAFEAVAADASFVALSCSIFFSLSRLPLLRRLLLPFCECDGPSGLLVRVSVPVSPAPEGAGGGIFDGIKVGASALIAACSHASPD